MMSDETIKRIAEEVSPTVKQSKTLLEDQEYCFAVAAKEWVRGD